MAATEAEPAPEPQPAFEPFSTLKSYDISDQLEESGSWFKILRAPLLVLLLIILSIVGFHYYQRTKFVNKVSSTLAQDAALIEEIGSYEKNNRTINYQEAIRKCNEQVRKRDGFIELLNAADPYLYKKVLDDSIALLRAENDYVKAKRNYYENVFLWKTAREQDEMIKRMQSGKTENVNLSIQELGPETEAIKEARAKVAAAVDAVNKARELLSQAAKDFIDLPSQSQLIVPETIK